MESQRKEISDDSSVYAAAMRLLAYICTAQIGRQEGLTTPWTGKRHTTRLG
jgi:hypothetical protein